MVRVELFERTIVVSPLSTKRVLSGVLCPVQLMNLMYADMIF